MIIRMHKTGGSFGHSFKGVGAYLLHDKEASTSDRVAWTETRNLATKDPETATRVMAATAMDQDRLKQEAGIKNTGRKSKQSVMHFALSWDIDETPTRSEMSHAVDAILFNLGKDSSKTAKNGRSQFANEHQALIVCHEGDSENPHVHVVVNRVHPNHGVMLPSSNDFLKASKFGLEYEKNSGQIRCTNRAINWEARDRGEFARDTKSLPRNIYEQIKQAGLDPDAARESGGSGDQRSKDAELAKKTRELKKRHAEQMTLLADDYKDRIAGLEADASQQAAIAKNKVRDKFRPKWEYRFHEKAAEQTRFEIDEDKFLGKVKNFAKTVDFKELFSGEDRKKALQQTFDALSSSGGRQEALRRLEQAKDRQLEKSQQEAENAATLPHFEKLDEDKAAARDHFLFKRSELLLSQRMDRAAINAEWDTRAEQRQEAFLSHAVNQNPDAGLYKDVLHDLEWLEKHDHRPENNQEQEKDRDQGQER